MTLTEALIQYNTKRENAGVFRAGDDIGLAAIVMFKSPELLKRYGNLPDDQIPDDSLMFMLTACTKYGIPAQPNGAPAVVAPTKLFLMENLIADDWEVRAFEEQPLIIQPEMQINIDPNKLRA